MTAKVTHTRFHLLKTKFTFIDVIISKQTTLRGSWIWKFQSSCVHDQNANAWQIFLPALCQVMNRKSFYELLNQLESDENTYRLKARPVENRARQINGSHEEISSVYELIFRTNIRLLVRKSRDKILILPLAWWWCPIMVEGG